MKLSPLRWTLGLVASFAIVAPLASVIASCDGGNGAAPILGGSTTPPVDASILTACAKPAPGCSCATPGAFASCTAYEHRSGDYVSCLSGSMVCENGVWGSCGSDSVADKLV